MRHTMRIILIRNPESGTASSHGDEVEAHVREAGHDLTSVSTRDHWREAITGDANLVVAMGGDGTVRRVATALIGRRVPLGIIPTGTANNVATSLGLTRLAPRDIVARWSSARTVPFDIMVAQGCFDDVAAIEGIGVGLFARTMAALDARDNLALAHADDAQEKLRAAAEHLRERLAEAPTITITATLDGRDISGAYVMFEICNVQAIGPNLILAPRATPTDGRFNVVMVTDDDRKRLDTLLARRGKSGWRVPTLPSETGTHLTFDWRGQELHIDDKAWPGTENSFDLEPGTIDVRIDPGAIQYLDVVGR
ncbi:MAG: diacylglycerol kinase family protein [Vicinamibacterales bacterium]